jgi:transcriptional regulator with XRE-family HTH domain
MVFNNEKLRKDLITRRVIDLNISLDKAAEEIGVSKATLSRIENNKTPEVNSFCKICSWLKTNPSDYFIIFAKKQDGFRP